MKRVAHILLWMSLILIIGCGGAKKNVAPEPPPPIDENLLNLVPFETDLLLWVDFAKLRTAPLWGIVDKVFQKGALNLPAEEAVNPIFSCNEAILAFMDSEQYGNQLLIIIKGDAAAQTAALAAVRKKEGATAQHVDGFNGIRTKEMFLLSLTPKTMILGNDAVVRMSAKAGLKKGRSIVENPDFAAFKTEGGATARMLYRSGLNTRTIQRFKTAVPRINPDAVTSIDGALTTDRGAHAAVGIVMETQMDASVFAEELGRTLNELKGNMIVLFLGIDWLRDRVTVVSDKNRVNIDVLLDERDIETLGQLAERLQKIQELLNGMGEGR